MLTRSLLLALPLLWLNPSVFADADKLNTQAVDALVQGYGQPDEPGISVAIAKDGELIYEGWRGLADLERKVAIGQRTRFHIASISKQFTAYAVLKLAEEGKLRVDQPLSDFFPELEAGRGRVKLRHLLDHTGGLREVNTLVQLLGLSERAPVTAEQMLALLLRQKGSNFVAGTDEEYSNSGYQLLAHVVAQLSRQSFADYLHSQVLDPLGMTETFVRTDPYALIENVAISYAAARQPFVHHPVMATGVGSTGMVSTPKDLLRWGHSLNVAEAANDPILQAMAQRSRLPDGRVVVAANGQEFRQYRGVKTWSHGGTAGGFKSFLLRMPAEGIVIAVMGNRADFLKAKFAFDVADVLLEHRLGPEPELDLRPETEQELDRYVGDYRLFPGTVFSLRRDGKALTFAGFGAADAVPLPSLSKGVFLLNPASDLRLEFRDFDDERATQMRWQVSEDGYLLAKRVEMEPIGDAPINASLCAGTYYSDELQIGFDIFEKEGALWITSNLNAAIPLIQYQPRTFRPEGPIPFGRLMFLEHGAKPVQTILVSAPLAKDIRFERQVAASGP